MKKSSAYKIISLVLCGAMLAGVPVSAAPTLAERLDYGDYEEFSDIVYSDNYYSKYHENFDGQYAGSDTSIVLNPLSFKAEGKAPEAYKDSQKGEVLNWQSGTKSITYTFNAAKAGLYRLAVSYFPIGGNTLGISRGIMIDGKYPFDEAAGIFLPRRFVDSGKPEVNSLGDELMPQQKEIKTWLYTEVWDNQGIYSSPLEFYLSAGNHTLTLEYIDQPVLISEIAFKATEPPIKYSELEKKYAADGRKTAEETLRFEAEDCDHIAGKSSSSILIGYDSDETMSPKAITKKKYNYIGYSGGGDSVTWHFKAKKDGLYKIALRSVQNANSGLPVYRTLEIDGKIPFAEMSGYTFPYGANWNTHILGGTEKPYLFYLTKGDHTLKMTAVAGELTPILHGIEQANSRLQTTYQNIVMVTGQSPDLNYDYELDKAIHGLRDDLGEIANILDDCRKRISALANQTSTVENSLKQVKATIEGYKKNIDAIPAGLDDFTAAMTNLGNSLTTLKTSTLLVDYIQIANPDETLEDRHQTIFNLIINSIRNLILSYTKDYNAIATKDGAADEKAKELKVWVSRSKEMAEILKELADSEFAAKNNVRLEFNLLPEGAFAGTVNTLLLAINAGNSPDVVLNMLPTTAAEYAARGVIKNLKDLDGFDAYSSYTIPQLFNPISYNGAVYGLPEVMGFNVMFYRKDMLERLHINVPNTWDEVYNNLLPRLNQYKLNMFIPQSIDMFLYQYGGEYYSADRKSSALSSEAAYNAFDRFIKNYTEYGFPYNVSFYNRFRTGEMVIGIGGMGEYMQIAYAAPELSGKWAIAPIPATVKNDGTLDRSFGGALQMVSVIMEETNSADKAWDFLKWWMNTDTQTEYGRRIEARMGISSRLGTANTEAFKALPWSGNDIEVISEAFKWIKEAPYVPGGYFTARHITNAISRCLTGNYAPRDSLEQAVEQINIELERKRRDFGIEE